MNNNYRNEYVIRVNNVVNYIHAHLDERLTLESLSDVALFSPFHFHRIFRVIVGATLNEYIIRARLQDAVHKLLYNPEMSITDIAFKCGFSSLSNFARVFKHELGMTASKYRKSKDSKISQTQSKMLEEIPAPEEYTKNIIKAWGNTDTRVQVQVKGMPAFRVAYIRHFGVMVKDITRVWQRLEKWMEARDLLTAESERILVGYDDPEVIPLSKCRCDVCFTVPQDIAAHGEVGIMDIPGGKHACCHIETDLIKLPNEMAHAFYCLYAEWLTESGYQPDNRPYYQIYRNNPEKGREKNVIVDICLPIKPL